MQNFEHLKDLVAQAEQEANAFYVKGNKAAGTRLRKAMKDISDSAKVIRSEVSDIKNAAKTT